jgi:hypothetical protein
LDLNEFFGRRRYRWVDNIKVDLVEIGWGGVAWIDLALESSCERDSEDLDSIKCWETIKSSVYTTGGLSSSAQLHRVSYCPK